MDAFAVYIVKSADGGDVKGAGPLYSWSEVVAIHSVQVSEQFLLEPGFTYLNSRGTCGLLAIIRASF